MEMFSDTDDFFQLQQLSTFDGLSSVGDVEVVFARLVWDVLHTAAAILVISAGHFGL